MRSSEIYIERSKSDSLSINDLNRRDEYYPCDRKDEEGIFVRDYGYYFVKREKDLCAYIEETIAPKFWNHKYISAVLYANSIKQAAEKDPSVSRVIGDSFEPEIIRILFAVNLFKDYSGEESIKDVIQAIDSIIDGIRSEAEVIAKRELTRYMNE